MAVSPDTPTPSATQPKDANRSPRRAASDAAGDETDTERRLEGREDLLGPLQGVPHVQGLGQAGPSRTGGALRTCRRRPGAGPEFER